jgi:hypothetical protein
LFFDLKLLNWDFSVISHTLICTHICPNNGNASCAYPTNINTLHALIIMILAILLHRTGLRLERVIFIVFSNYKQ